MIALHRFGFAQDRLRLGQEKKNKFSFCLALALHYLCHINKSIEKE